MRISLVAFRQLYCGNFAEKSKLFMIILPQKICSSILSHHNLVMCSLERIYDSNPTPAKSEPILPPEVVQSHPKSFRVARSRLESESFKVVWSLRIVPPRIGAVRNHPESFEVVQSHPKSSEVGVVLSRPKSFGIRIVQNRPESSGVI